LTSGHRSRRRLSLIACALLAASRAGGQCDTCANPSFASAVRIYADAVVDIAVADFDGDRVPDLATVGGYSGNADQNPFVVIRLGIGDGTFGPPTQHPLPHGALLLAAGDFDGDGHTDLAAVDANGDKIEVLLGVGDGSFVDGPTTHVTNLVYSIRAADFDGDGFVDLAVINSGQTLFLHSLGDGTFEQSILAELDSLRLVVGDFNGDGIPDIVSDTSGLATLLGNGDGTFRPPVISPSLHFGSITTADFDGDGRSDVAQLDWTSGVVQVFLANPDGTFQAGVQYFVGIQPNNLASADFGRDGRPDLAVVTQDGDLEVFSGRGDGTFLPPVEYPVLFQPMALAVRDLNGDDTPDLLVASYQGPLEVHVSDGSGAFRFPVRTPLPGVPLAVASIDLNSDGKSDVAVATGDVIAGPRFSTWLSHGNGSFQASASVALNAPPRSLILGDWNSDGKPDAVIGTAAGVEIVVASSQGGFGATSMASPIFPDFLASGDFVEDGKTDFIASSMNGTTLAFYAGNGDGTFHPAVPTTVSGVVTGAIVAADLNGDGHLDLATASSSQLTVLLGNGHGAFTAGFTVTGLVNATQVVIADFNADSKPDLGVTTSDGILVYPGLGGGAFDKAMETPLVAAGYNASAADFNGDGILDLLIGGSGTAAVLMGKGDGTFQAPVFYLLGKIGSAGATGDFDGDGKPDFVAGSFYSPEIFTFLNSACSPSHLLITGQPTSCNVPGSAFETQPEVKVFDDGDNVIACDTGTVTASIASGTGSSGATLQGTTAVAAVAGVATFSDLAIDLPGRGYRLEFSHPLAGKTRSRTLTQGLAVALNGPALTCDGFPPTYRTGTGLYDRYVWKLDNAEVSRGPMPTLSGLSPGDHTLEVDVFQDGCTASQSRTITVQTGPAAPSIGAPLSVPAVATGLLASVTPHLGSSYHWSLLGGTITAGQGTEEVTFTAGPAGMTMTLEAIEVSAAGCESPADHARIQVDFADVPLSDPFHDAVNAMARNGISHGCGGGKFCPDTLLTRDQMAIFLLKAEHGGNYQAPPLDFFGTGFADVAAGDFADTFIKQLGVEKITTGCGGGNYCPHDPVTRSQMAIFLLRIEHGADYKPPTATGEVFDDVAASDFGARFIEQLAREGISGGCGNGNFCPNATVSRAQMAAFLKRTLNLR